MRSKIKLLSALAVVSSAIVSHPALATDGTITFNGNITANSCTISGNGGTKDFTVSLPKLSTTALGTTVGTTAGFTPFEISLSSCGDTSGSIRTHFEAGANVDAASGHLTNSATASAATGVQVQLLNRSDRSLIRAGFPLATQNSLAGTLAGTGAGAAARGSATLQYAAQYVTSAAAPTAGAVSTSVQYSIIYP